MCDIRTYRTSPATLAIATAVAAAVVRAAADFDIAEAAVAERLANGADRASPELEEAGPTTRNGKPVPQGLYHACTQGSDIQLKGHFWGDQMVRAMDPRQVALLVIDMQPLFYSKHSTWGNTRGLDGSPMKALVPVIERLARGISAAVDPTHVAFTQFITPEDAHDASGSWQRYYSAEGNREVTQAWMRRNGLNVSHILSVMPALQPLVTASGVVLNKTTASAFASGPTRTWLRQLAEVSTLILVGVETDFCVLATALSAVDAGYRVVIVLDGIASSQPNSGQATLDYIARRFDFQIEMGSADEVLRRLGEQQQTAGVASAILTDEWENVGLHPKF